MYVLDSGAVQGSAVFVQGWVVHLLDPKAAILGMTGVGHKWTNIRDWRLNCTYS